MPLLLSSLRQTKLPRWTTLDQSLAATCCTRLCLRFWQIVWPQCWRLLLVSPYMLFLRTWKWWTTFSLFKSSYTNLPARGFLPDAFWKLTCIRHMIPFLGSSWSGCSSLLDSQLSFVPELWNVSLPPPSTWRLMDPFMVISKGSVV